MRILLLNYEFPPLGGGASPVSFEIAKQISERENCTVDVVTMGYKGLPSYEKINNRLHIYRVPCLRKKKEMSQPLEQLTYLFSAYFKVRELVKNNAYDICHCHFIIPTGVLAYIIKKQFGIPYVLTAHGSDVPGYNPDRFKLLHKFTGPLLKTICDNAHKIIALSSYLKGLINTNIKKYSDNKLLVIPNGIDSKQFVPLQKKQIILSTGRLLPRKGFQYLIQAVSSKNIGYDVHICGDGPMMPVLKDMAKKSRTKIHFHGWVDNKSTFYKELLGKTSIYCLVSSRENASISLLEAMSAGCAVITTNISGCPETVHDTGIVIPPENALELQKKLERLIENPKLISTLGAKARERVIKVYNWDILVSEYMKHLSSS